MSSSDLAVSVRGLSKSYSIAKQQGPSHSTLAETMLARLKSPLRRTERETFWALNDVNFDIKKGEVVGIIGRNGAGKSTLLKILSRITEPTAGAIDLYGRVGSLLEVGTGFHPELTGRENIFLNGAILGMSRDEIRKQFERIVDFAGTEQFLDVPVKRYSSGMYVRLAFSVAAHLRSDILIVDEVLAVGDAEFQKKCMGALKTIGSDGKTVLFVSHNIDSVAGLCEKALLLRKGKVCAFGPVQNLMQALLGDSSDNASRIVDNLRFAHDSVLITNVLANGAEAQVVTLQDSDDSLVIEVSGTLQRRQRLDMEIEISDAAGRRFAVFSPGHASGKTEFVEAGEFTLTRRVQLPTAMNRCELVASIYLTHHNTEYWAKMPDALRILVGGRPTKTGRIFDQAAGHGWFLLDHASVRH